MVGRDMDQFALDPARPPPPLMERAYELAASGKLSTVEDICMRLVSEGYENVYLHFECRAATRTELLRICRRAQAGSGSLRAVPGSNERVSRPRSQRFEMKAAECRQLAHTAIGDEAREVYARLAGTYEQLAQEAARNEGDVSPKAAVAISHAGCEASQRLDVPIEDRARPERGGGGRRDP
jgi:hypothetical protein